MSKGVQLSPKDQREIVDLFREALESADQTLRDTPGWWHALGRFSISSDLMRQALSVDAVTIDRAQDDLLVNLAVTPIASAKPGNIASIGLVVRADESAYSPVELVLQVCVRDYDEDQEDNRFWNLNLTYAGWKWKVR